MEQYLFLIRSFANAILWNFVQWGLIEYNLVLILFIQSYIYLFCVCNHRNGWTDINIRYLKKNIFIFCLFLFALVMLAIAVTIICWLYYVTFSFAIERFDSKISFFCSPYNKQSNGKVCTY